MAATPDRGTSLANQPAPSPSSPLLQLPVELVLQVADYLPLVDNMVLAQTCGPLWTILHSHLHLDLRRAATGMGLGRDRHLEYLACLARDSPEIWLCESCRRLHRITGDVLPPGHQPCLLDPSRFVYCPDPLAGFHHVQLALKARRMSDEDPASRLRVRQLLAPHCRRTEGWDNVRDDLVTHVTTRPRIVAGKFLLQSTSVYSQLLPDAPLTRETMDSVAVCVHLSAPGRPADKRFDPALARAVDAAMADPGVREVRGSCSRCATDFAVEATPRRLTLRAWRSLGPEGSPQNPEWRAQLDFMTKRKNREPGRVRELYEGDEEGAQG